MEQNLKSASLKKLIVHYVGSKNNLEAIHLASELQNLEEEALQIIGESFLNKFNSIAEQYSFHHPSSLQYNEIYNYALEIFQQNDGMVTSSVKMAKHLYESSTHPKVKGGELYVAYFENLPVEGRMMKAVGLFKTENKALFLDAQHSMNEFSLNIKEGVDINKIDKGCLIIYTNTDEGFDVMIFDNQNRGEEALYWKETFLGLTPKKDEYHHTNQFLTLTKQYITEQMESEFGLPKKEQIELLSKSIDYFRSKESFEIEEFQTEVFADEDKIQSFRNFGSRFTESHNVDIAASFDINTDAVKKQSRVYKSVLKLDRNFHIYIHGNTDLIEKGIDLDGRKYYKIYYQDEA